MAREGFYRQGIPDIGLAIERSSGHVPDNGKYYVLYNGEVLGAFRSLKQAQALYQQKRQEIGYEPKPPEPKETYNEDIENYFHAWESYWSQSHRHRGGGGRGGRGGV